MRKFPAGWLDCDVLKLGHHGSATTSNWAAWLEVVRPEVAVASCGSNGGGTFKAPG